VEQEGLRIDRAELRGRGPYATSSFDHSLQDQHNAIGTAQLCRRQDNLLELPTLASLFIEGSSDVRKLRLHDAKGKWHFECLIFVSQSISLHVEPGNLLIAQGQEDLFGVRRIEGPDDLKADVVDPDRACAQHLHSI
jgi:hypothetical protein